MFTPDYLERLEARLKAILEGTVKLSPDSADCAHEEHKTNVSRTSIPIRNHQPRCLVVPQVLPQFP